MVIFESEFVMIIFIIQARKNKNTTNWTQFEQTKPGSKWTVVQSEPHRMVICMEMEGLLSQSGPSWVWVDRPVLIIVAGQFTPRRSFSCWLFDRPFSQAVHWKFLKPSNLSLFYRPVQPLWNTDGPLWPNFILHCTNLQRYSPVDLQSLIAPTIFLNCVANIFEMTPSF